MLSLSRTLTLGLVLVWISTAEALTFGDLVTNNSSIVLPNGLTFSNFSGNVSVDERATDGITFSSPPPSLNTLIVNSGFTTGVNFGMVQNLLPPPQPQTGDLASINFGGISLAGTILHSRGGAYPFTITYTLNYTVTGLVGPRLLVYRADVGGVTKWEHAIGSPNSSIHNTWDPDDRTSVEQVGLGVGIANRELRVTDILVLSPFIELDGPTGNACLTNASGCPFHVFGNAPFLARPAGFSTGFQTAQAVPEPSTILLLATGLVALWVTRLNRRSRRFLASVHCLSQPSS